MITKNNIIIQGLLNRVDIIYDIQTEDVPILSTYSDWIVHIGCGRRVHEAPSPSRCQWPKVLLGKHLSGDLTTGHYLGSSAELPKMH